MKSARIFIFLISFLFFSSQPSLAVSVTISNVPSTVTEEPFSVHVSVSGAQENTTNYVRINFYELGKTQYFGYTHNGSDWYNESTYTNYFPITIGQDGFWSGDVQGKLDSSSSYYKGPGSYGLKARRYTAGGSHMWSNEVTVTVTGSAPTPTPSPTTVPTNTPTPTNIPTPTKTPTPTPTVKPTATPKPARNASASVAGGPTARPTPTTKPSPAVQLTSKTTQSSNNISISKKPLPTSILGETTKNIPTEKPAPTIAVKTLGSSQNNLPKILIGFGVLFLVSCGILAFRLTEKGKMLWEKFIQQQA